MGKRSSHAYSSEDAVLTNEHSISLYYCACDHLLLILTRELNDLPVRRTDGSRVWIKKKPDEGDSATEGPGSGLLESAASSRTDQSVEKCTGRLESEPTLLRRKDGKVERQWRMVCSNADCNLPFGYSGRAGNQDTLFLLPSALFIKKPVAEEKKKADDEQNDSQDTKRQKQS